METNCEGNPSQSKESLQSEEDPEEPKLKYERINGHLEEILLKDGASSIYVNDKLVILGTNWGRIHVLDHQGNKVREFHYHSGPVTMIDMDSNGDYIASCAHDKKVVVQELYSTENCVTVVLDSLVRCVAIEPHYGRPRSRKKFVLGTNKIIQYEKGLFGAVKSNVLVEGSHTGEIIRTMSWGGRFLAWAIDSAVRVMDMEETVVISLIRREHSLAMGCDQYPPHLCWHKDLTLLIGWGDTVKVCRVVERTPDLQSADMDLPPYCVEIVYMFTTSFYVCGIRPLDQLVVVLAFNKSFKRTDSGDLENVSSSHEWKRPQLRVLLPAQDSYEELSKDVLLTRCYQEYHVANYHFTHLHEDRRFYIVCPQDVVVAKPREPQDRVQWLLEHEKFQAALEVVENCGGKVALYTKLNVGQIYLDHLLEVGKFKEAANLVPNIYGQDKLLWEQIVSVFKCFGQLKELSLLIPTGPPGPLLPKRTYENVLLELLKRKKDHQTFLELIKVWPKNLYDVCCIINIVLSTLTPSTTNEAPSVVLLCALAHLYSNCDQHEKALAIYLKLKHKDVFGLIHRHSLYSCFPKHIVELMTLDVEAALEICSQHILIIDPLKVVTGLSKQEFFLYKYLDMLYTNQKEYSFQFHNLLIKLYANYDKSKLLPLLMSSNHIDLDPALQVVTSHCLVAETVFLLNRMGSSEKALRIVLEEENDLDWAIKICQEHSDADLWKILVDYSIDKPEYIRVLLNNMGAHVDPLLILRRIPSNLEIPGLRDALAKIMHDYELKITLQNGYKTILVGDCIKLLERQVATQSSAIPVRGNAECSICTQKLMHSTLDEDSEIVLFACKHIYHSKCLSHAQPNMETCVVCTSKKVVPSS